LHKITFIAVVPWSHLCGPAQKEYAFIQPLSHNEFGFAFPKPKVT